MEVEILWHGLTVLATVSFGWEGDPSIPGGTNLIAELEGISVLAPDGEDIYELFTPEAKNMVERAAIEEGRTRCTI